jgi:hypothetical protein
VALAGKKTYGLKALLLKSPCEGGDALEFYLLETL